MIICALIVSALLSGCSGFVVPAGKAQTTDTAPAADKAQTADVTPAGDKAQAEDNESTETEIPALSLTRTPGKEPDSGAKTDTAVKPKKADKGKEGKSKDTESRQQEITEDGVYHDLESVVLYYDKFGKLPSNFITKKEAKDLGWEGGALNPYRKGASIGGDYFGNFEKRLPADKGVKYIECDIDTNGGKRGAKRLIISSTGKYYYTSDHYETFDEVDIVDGKVVVK